MAIASRALGALGLATSLTGDTLHNQYVYHFTTQAGYDGISATRSILPSGDNLVYVTPNAYLSGEQAQSDLALRNTPTGYFVIPKESILPANPPTIVAPANGQPGRGLEITVPLPVSAAGAAFIRIEP